VFANSLYWSNFVGTGDFDGDGNVDLAFDFSSRTYPQAGIRVAYGDGTGSFPSSTWTMAPTGGGYVYDVDGDGIDDLVADEGLRLVVRYGTPRRRLEEQRLPPLPWTLRSAFGVYVDDIDQDGHPDIIWTLINLYPINPSTSHHRVYKNEGGRRFSLETMDVTPPAASTFVSAPRLTIADFDGDGDSDWVERWGGPSITYYANRARYHLGCGTTPPQITLTGTSLGQPMTLGIGSGPAGLQGWLAISPAQAAPLPTTCLPAIDLMAPGAFALPLTTDPAGTASLTFTLPAGPALHGTIFFTQWGAADPSGLPVFSDARTVILW
jgi:hypothetical protein